MNYGSKREWRRHLRKRKPKRQGSRNQTGKKLPVRILVNQKAYQLSLSSLPIRIPQEALIDGMNMLLLLIPLYLMASSSWHARKSKHLNTRLRKRKASRPRFLMLRCPSANLSLWNDKAVTQMDDKRFAVLLTDAQEVKILECDPQKEMFDIAREAIGCEWIELIEPEPLARDGLVMMIDEEGKLRNGTAFINCVASHLYGSERHGDPIVGHAVIVKSAEESLKLLTAAEAKQVAFSMEQSRGLAIEKIAEAFGLRPAHKKTQERSKPTRRQPCKKNNMER